MAICPSNVMLLILMELAILAKNGRENSLEVVDLVGVRCGGGGWFCGFCLVDY